MDQQQTQTPPPKGIPYGGRTGTTSTESLRFIHNVDPQDYDQEGNPRRGDAPGGVCRKFFGGLSKYASLGYFKNRERKVNTYLNQLVRGMAIDSVPKEEFTKDTLLEIVNAYMMAQAKGSLGTEGFGRKQDNTTTINQTQESVHTETLQTGRSRGVKGAFGL